MTKAGSYLTKVGSYLKVNKAIIEIIAIMLAGLFGFFTWGINYISLSKPNWDLILIPDGQLLPAIDKHGINTYCYNDTACILKATGFMLAATLKIINHGNGKIVPGTTNVKLYFMKRFKANNIITNNSVIEYYKKTCLSDSLKEGCQKEDYSFNVEEIDEQPIYPGIEGWRPFTIEINTSKLNKSKSLIEFSKENILLIVIKQPIVSEKYIWFDKRDTSTLLYIYQDICNLRSFKLKMPD